MHPKVIIHTTISLDTAFTGFAIDLEVHYATLLSFKPEAVLTGSASAAASIDAAPWILPPEEASDKYRPAARPGDRRPVGVFVDSRGVLKDRLHFFRRLEHIRDVVVLATDETPHEYLEYLSEREYPFIRCGQSRVDLRAALRRLADEYAVSCVVSDSGGALTAALIEEGIADEISLVVSPVIAGDRQKKLFESVKAPISLELIHSAPLERGAVHLLYRLIRSGEPR